MDALNNADSRRVVRGLRDFGVVPRQDIDILLSKEPDTFNLFLIALKELQESPDFNNPMGYYQIAGIHGLPNRAWDNVSGKNVISAQGAQSGYCAHGVETFPTWHRPYLSMLEQSIFKKMSEVAEKYTDANRKTAYRAAVRKFRLPYWDYHRPRDFNATFPGITDNRGLTFYPYDFRAPQILTVANVSIKMYPDDKQTQIKNPLNRFHFPTGAMPDSDWNVSGLSPTAAMKTDTSRWPAGRGTRFDSLTSLNGAINEYREESTRLSLLFIENGAYNGFVDYATAGVRVRDPLSGRIASGSLESVHGNYHGIIGGLGHMSQVPTAAFDPIFWLHHCQVDRWFAVWQAAHPGSWFPDRNQAQESLMPFRNESRGFWNSNDSTTTDAFGYTYPDLQGDAAAVRRRFVDRYSWARRLTSRDDPNVRPPPEMEPLDLSSAPVFQGITDFKPLDKRRPAPRAAAAADAAPKSLTTQSASAAAPSKGVPANDEIVTLFALPDPQVFATQAAPAPKAKPQAAMVVQKLPQAVLHEAPPVEHHDKPEIREEKVSREWYVDDVVERLALNNSFSILYFIGAFDNTNTPSNLLLAPAFAGLNHVFTAPVEACDHCGKQEEQAALVSSTSPITSMLLDYVSTGQLQSMRPEHVKPFLLKNLRWRAVTVGGTTVNPRDLAQKGYKVSVSCKVAPLPGEEGQVVYETYPEITQEIIANAS